MMALKNEKGTVFRRIILGLWGLFCFLPILFFASIALRPRNEIIAPQPIYFPTLSI
jgi:multiple sugar transport system permease protein